MRTTLLHRRSFIVSHISSTALRRELGCGIKMNFAKALLYDFEYSRVHSKLYCLCHATA